MITGATGLFSFKYEASGVVLNCKFEVSVDDGLRKTGVRDPLLVGIRMRYREYKS